MPRLGSAINCNGLKIYNLDTVTTDPTAAASVGRLTSVEANLAAAIATQEATLRAVINNLDVKDATVVAATSNVNVATGGLLTIQGVTLVAGDRVLLTAQTNAAENGIYDAAAGAWTRSLDADSDSEVTSGMAIPVRGGDLANQDLWILGTADPIAIGTTPLSFSRQRNLRDLTTSGGGLNLSPSYDLSLIGKTGEIYINPTGGIEIADDYVGQASITTLGTITTGVWHGSTVAIPYGGTGATTVDQAKANLGIPITVGQTVGDGVNTIFTITHNLNNRDIDKPDCIEIASGEYIEIDCRIVDANNISVSFANPPASNSVRILVDGVKLA